MSSIVGLFTDVLPPGGVQRAGRHVAAVAAKFAADRKLACNFLSLNDPPGSHTVRIGPIEFVFSGHGGNKTRFLLAALSAAKSQPMLVVALHPHLAPVASLMRASNCKFRFVVFTHGVEVWQRLDWPRGAALRRADLVFAPSADTARHLVSTQGVSAARIQQLSWALDPEFEARVTAGASLRPPAEFPRKRPVILTVGRWDSAEKYKGADTLIAALPRVLKSGPDASLVLVGDGTDRPRLERLSHDLQVADRVHFLRGLTPEQLSACYAGCDVFALPSRGEGFGMVFLEAMAYGKSVIGGAHGGIPDIVEDGKTGLLVPHGDVERLAQALEFVFADSVRASQMGARGRDRVTREFSFAQFQYGLAEAFVKALETEHGPKNPPSTTEAAGV